MTLLYLDPRFTDHKTGAHPEQPARTQRVAAHLEQGGWLKRCDVRACVRAEPAWLQRAHGADYIAAIEQAAERGGGRIEVDTVISQKSYEVCVLAAGTVCDATRRVVQGEAATAFCLVRPPGHHALRDAPMGFCVFNSIAVAAHLALAELQLNRVLIVDWDVHHGNGTQAEFWTSDRVGFFSIHRYPFYPGSGTSDETGSGAGLGYTLNLPVEFGTSRQEYLARFRARLEEFANKVRPELILLSAGFDAHRLDPVGSLGLENEDFTPLTDIVLDLARAHCGGKLVSVLEGGYHLDMLPISVGNHLDRLLAT